jgi:hypothetical protein
MPATASHEKLGEFHRMQYLTMLHPTPARSAICMLWRDPLRLARIAFGSTYISPVAEWDPHFFAPAKDTSQGHVSSAAAAAVATAAAAAAAAIAADARRVEFGAVGWKNYKIM